MHAGAEWAIAVGEGRPAGNAAEVWLAIHSGGRQVTHRLTARSTAGVDTAGLITPVLDRLRRELKATSAGAGHTPNSPDAAKP